MRFDMVILRYTYEHESSMFPYNYYPLDTVLMKRKRLERV